MSLPSLRTLRLACTLSFAATLCSLPVLAQTSGNGNIAGVVTDASGAAVPGASVVVINTDTGVARKLTTNGGGIYTASFLVPGHYEVTATAPSFGKVDRKNILLTVGEVLAIDAKLPASSSSTTVDVTAESPILDADKTEVSQTLDEQLIANLPVATRNWNAFVLLTPNVTQDGGTGLISFHGISGLYNQNYVDGSNNNQMLFSEARGRSSGAPYVYSADSIKEFQAETSNYSVEFGQAAGGQVNAITKNGTNNLHGDLFYDLRYPDMNALDPYSKYQALHNGGNSFLLTQPIHQQQQFGGSVGGPLIKDRLFYFFTYDGFRKVGRVLYTDSNLITQTPTTTSANNVISPTQCPTTISSAQCTSAIAFLLNTAIAAPGRFQKENLFFPRLDYHINSKNDAFVDFNFVDFDSSFGYNSSNTFTNSSPTTNATTHYHERFVVGGLTTQIGSSSVNQIHAQWGRDLETAGSNAPGPSISMGVDTYGMNVGLPRPAEPDEHRIQFTDVFSTTRGHHTFKFGGDVNLVHEVMINLYTGGGSYSYGGSTPLQNFQSWAQDSFSGTGGDTDPYQGYHYGSYTQVVDQVNTVAGTQGKDDFWMKMYDAFAEDTWKIRPTFTLTAGVRYDIQVTPATQYVNNLFAPLSTKYTQTIKNTNRIQPRIGFSWQAYPGTIVRGGYGIFSALNQGSTYYADRVENGVVQLTYAYTGCGPTTGTSTSFCASVPAAGSKLAFPNVPFTPSGPSISGALYPTGGTAATVTPLTAAPAYSFHGLDPNFVPPYAQEFDASVEQQLPGKMSLQVGYVGTRGMRLPVFVDSNLIGVKPSGIRTYDVLNSASQVTKVLTVPVYRPQDRVNQNLSTFNTGFSIANTWYNSLAVSVRRPFANGLEVIGNYTWARATDTGAVGGANGTFYGGDTPLDPNNIKADNGPSDTDIRNRMTLSFVYKPRLFEGNKILKQVVDGFTFSGSDIASGGQPIFLGMSGTVYAGNTNPSSYGNDGNIYGGAISSGSGGATTGRPPQIGRNSIVGPGFNDFDFRLSRDLPIYRKIYMQISAEAFNLLNHTIITGVNGTYSQYAPAATSGTCSTAAGSATGSTVPTGSTLQGCISPYSGTGLTAFGATSGTNNGLYSARQAQFSAKLFF
jgi:hypothetical protein